jgi:hypothetical protein
MFTTANGDIRRQRRDRCLELNHGTYVGSLPLKLLPLS